VIETRITCDFCGRSAGAADKDQEDRWGTVSTPTRQRDICPSCLAELDGWQRERRTA
jgi:hypothetical protein